ncbi:O-antigen ligase family protein [Aquibacillus koreensis]|uniref:O-antigen ligase family protein n=1 Tax=Aquibacillus koreensis TaxID=279446 RepID=A0A9X3WJI3_9BACI|nr:O-antigen ligase family protein [Aquibacillus koreensis]MCT2535120.1 O-antigen ligase family protein [Aquibacillus koreensis]MDC3419763.1 O-antigen ligase family protein [Aquibacillus koreensis]
MLKKHASDSALSTYLLLLVLVAPMPGILFGEISIKLIDLFILGISFLFLLFYMYEQQLTMQAWGKRILTDAATVFIILASVSVVISTIYGSVQFPEDTAISDVYELYRYVYYITFYLLSAYFVIHLERFTTALFWTVLGMQLFGIFQFFNWFNINEHIGLLYTKSDSLHMMITAQHRITSTLGNPNVYGSFLLIVLVSCLAIVYMYPSQSKRFTFMAVGLLLLTFISIFLTTSRTTVIAAFGILFYFGLLQLIIREVQIKKIILYGMLSVLVFLGIGMALVPHIPYLESAVKNITNTLDKNANDTANESEEGQEETNRVRESLESVGSFKSRYDYWEINKEKFMQSPILGVGPMKQSLSFADNNYLYLLARYGVIGLLIYGVFLFYVYIKTFRIALRKETVIEKRIIASAINAIIVAYAVMAYVAESFFNIESMIVFFFLLGLLNNPKLKIEKTGKL